MVVGFWGVEVKAGVPLRVKADKENGVKISQATLSEVENKGGNESIHLVLNVNDQKFVIGTLIPEEISQIFYDLFLDRDFELSHNGKNESIYFCGYRPTSFVESDDDTDSDIGELPLIFKENGEPEQTEEKPILNTEKAAAKSKVTIVKPKKGDNTNEDDEEDSDEDDESESQEEKPNLTTEKATARSKVTIVKPKKGDNTNGDSDEDSDKDSDEDDESESQEEKPNLTTEKAAARSKVTIVEPKKGDNTNEDDDEDSDEYSDDEAKSQEERPSFEGEVDILEHQPLSQCAQTLSSEFGMDRTDFDLSGVEIDFTQFDGVYLDADNFVDLAATTSSGDGNATTTDTVHAGSSGILADDDSSRKRKAPESDTPLDVENASVPLSVPPSCTNKLPACDVSKGSVDGGLPPKPAKTPSSPFSVPIFSPSFILEDRRVTIADSAWNDPPIAYMMTQHTKLPVDRKVMKKMSDQDIKANLICLTAQIKDLSGELIDRDNAKDIQLKKLKANCEQLLKERENLKAAANQIEANQKFKEDFYLLKNEMANLKKSHETHLADMRTMIAQAENRAQASEAETNSLRLKLSEATNDLTSITVRATSAEAKNVMLESEITKLKGDNRTESFAYECAMKAMNEKFGKLESAIKEKDEECTAWYKDMEAKSKLAVDERVKAEIAAFIRSRTVPRKISDNIPLSPSSNP